MNDPIISKYNKDYHELSNEQQKKYEQIDHKIKSLLGKNNELIVTEIEDEISKKKARLKQDQISEIKCTECGQKLKSNDKFCSNCGNKIKK